jgi:hypothetical protein
MKQSLEKAIAAHKEGKAQDVDFYDAVLSILKLSEERYSLDTHRIRYEDLVLNFEENISNLLTFLDLKWEEELRSYQKTALARGRIMTPSSS